MPRAHRINVLVRTQVSFLLLLTDLGDFSEDAMLTPAAARLREIVCEWCPLVVWLMNCRRWHPCSLRRHFSCCFSLSFLESSLGVTVISCFPHPLFTWWRSAKQSCVRVDWGGRPGLSVLTSLLVSVDVKNYWTVLRHWSQLVPNMSTDIW